MQKKVWAVREMGNNQIKRLFTSRKKAQEHINFLMWSYKVTEFRWSKRKSMEFIYIHNGDGLKSMIIEDELVF